MENEGKNNQSISEQSKLAQQLLTEVRPTAPKDVKQSLDDKLLQNCSKGQLSKLLWCVGCVALITTIVAGLGFENDRLNPRVIFSIKTILGVLFSSVSLFTIIKWLTSTTTLQESLKFSLITLITTMAGLGCFEIELGSFSWGVGVAILAIPLFKFVDRNND